jgi:hypothetical protein
LNRSQVTAAVFKKAGCDVKRVLAGGDSCMNPKNQFSTMLDESKAIIDENFKAVFGHQREKK